MPYGINLPKKIEVPIEKSRFNYKWIPEWNKMQDAFNSVVIKSGRFRKMKCNQTFWEFIKTQDYKFSRKRQECKLKLTTQMNLL